MASKKIAGITIEIDGKTSKLENALKGVNKTLGSTQTSLKDVNKLLKLDPKNTELLQQKQEYLSKAISDTEAKLKTEKEALAQMKANSTTDEVTEEQKALEREIEATEQDLKGLKDQYTDFGSVASQKLQVVGEKFKEVGKKMTDTGKTLTKKVTTPIVGIGTAAVKVAADFDEQMTKVGAIAGSTGEEMDTLRSKAREMGAKTKFSATEAGEAMEYMGMAGWKSGDMIDGLEGIMNLAAASGEDLGTASDIVTDALTAFGLSAKDSGHFADILATASTNANTNVSMMGETFKYAAPVAGALGYSAEDTAVAIGLMANAGIKASQAGTSLRGILTNMAKPTKDSAAAMERLGISLTNDQGEMYSFREIMDQMRASFGEINMPVEEFNAQVAELDQMLADGTITQSKYDKALEELTLQAYGAEGAEKARTAAMLAGKNGMSGLLAIVNASEEDYRKLTEAVDGCSETFVKTTDGSVMPMAQALQEGKKWTDEFNGSTEAMASTMQDNLNGQLTILKSQLEEAAISIGEALMPSVRDIVSKFQEWVDKFNSLSPATKDLIIKIGLVAAAVGPLLIAVGSISTGIGSVINLISGGSGLIKTIAGGGGLVTSLGGLATAAAPFLAGGAIVAGVIAGCVVIYKNWDTLKAGAKAMVDGVKKGWDTLKTNTVKTFNAIKTNTVKAFNTAKQNVTKAASNITSTVSKKFTQAKNKATAAFSSMQSSVRAKFAGLQSNVTAGAGKILSTITTKFNAAKSKGSAAFNSMTQTVKSKYNAMKNTVVSQTTALSTKFTTTFNTMKSKATTAFSTMASTIQTKFNAAKQKINAASASIGTTLSTKVNAAKNTAAKAFGSLSTTVSNKMTAMRNSVTKSAEAIASKIKNKLGGGFDSVASSFQNLKNKLSNFHFNFPKFKMPHFTLEYGEKEFFGQKFRWPKGFKVSWYKKAYDNPVMFTRPTVLQTPYGAKGFGDGRGGEIVLSEQKLREIAGGGATYNINVYGAPGQNVNELADAVQRRLVALQNQRKAAGLA